MIVEVKNGRIWIQNNRQYQKKFIEIFIRNQDKETSFVAVIPKDGRFYIPIDIRDELCIKDKVDITKIEILQNIKRDNVQIKKNNFNILAFIPEKTLSGYEIIVIDKRDKYLCWYCTQGRPSGVLMNKEINLSFSRFLGYYQAEGGKPKLTKRRGRTLCFVNTKFELIKDFFNLSKEILNIKIWNVSIKHNKKLRKDSLEDIKNRLETMGIAKNNISTKEVGRIKDYSITLWISNSLLAEIIQNMNKEVKGLILKEKNREIFENYFRGVMAGDGNFFAYRDKKGSLHSRISFYEEKEDSIKAYKKILDSYGLDGKIKKIKYKNMYTLTITNNWDKLLCLLRYDMLLFAPHHKKKLIWTIKNHKKYRALKYLAFLDNKFDSRKIKNLSNKNYSYSAHWLEDREKEGLIEFIENEKHRKIWKLTRKGEEIKKILSSIL